jgi:tripartite-type tricarboxylate transporter receptor subunit TctC
MQCKHSTYLISSILIEKYQSGVDHQPRSTHGDSSMTTRTILMTGIAVLGLANAAQAFPEKAVTLIVPFGAGGSADTISRTLAAAMEAELGKPMVTLNRAGAAGTIGAAQLAAAKPDGYTIGMLPTNPLAAQPNLRDLPYSVDSFEYVCKVYANPPVMAVAADSDFASIEDLVSYAKSNPGKVRYGSSGPGSIQHLAMLDFSAKAGIETIHVPHSGDSENMRSTLGKVITGWPVVYGVVNKNSASIKALAVMSSERVADFESVPTFDESGYDVSFSIWGGLVAPAGTPPEALEALGSACASAVNSDVFKETMDSLQVVVSYSDGDSFKTFSEGEFDKLGTLLGSAGLK